MRVLWHGVGCDKKTGYGGQTSLFTQALKDAGHEVAINPMLDQYSTGVDRNGIVNFACGIKNQMMGNDYILAHAERWGPDCVLSMCDPFTCKPEVFDKLSWYPFVMVDSEPLLWENAEVMRACKRPIAPTQYAASQLRDAGFDPLYCPLAIDCGTFRPLDKIAAKEELGNLIGSVLTDKYVIVMNAANHSCPSRKNFAAAFKAYSIFLADSPDAVLYVHTDAAGTMYPGEDLAAVERLYGIEGRVLYPPQYEYNCGMIGSQYLAIMYNAADVFLHTARGEGFGLPMLEAQACGTPVVAPDFGNMAELNYNGIRVNGCARFMYHPGTEQVLVDPVHVAGALAITRGTGSRPGMSDLARAARVSWAQEYDISNVTENYLLPMLEEIEDAEKKDREAGGAGDRAGVQCDKADNPVADPCRVRGERRGRRAAGVSGLAAAV